ncbi:hypothetical protein OS493_032814 [Desmophyllum pertusum]|uniref:Uncharacterized protein n=1 Tax=Desmophyllum pertusum TaxID=174260 RepID=A0A9X0CV50_9CNID|nr:hypothetical protein OS493_032814 [Desmophyllum pertusum]
MRVANISRRHFFLILAIGGVCIYVFTNINNKTPVSSSTNKYEITSPDLKKVKHLVETEKGKVDLTAEKGKDEYTSVDTLFVFLSAIQEAAIHCWHLFWMASPYGGGQ